MTAVVVTHNSARHLAELGESFAAGSMVPARLLVVDNASVDDTVEYAALAGFEVLMTGSNNGYGAGCNVGLNATATEFVLFCNPDVRPPPNALERLVDALTDTPSAAIAGAALENPIKARRFSRITADLVGFLPRRLKHRMRRFGQDLPVNQHEDKVLVDYAVGAFILCRVSALESVGGFDDRFFLYCEEEDLCRRLGERGWQTLLVPSSIVMHEESASSEGVDETVMAPFRIHSLYWYYRRHRSRAYAECARCLLAMFIAADRAYRAVTRRTQGYGPKAAIAPFRSIDAIRRDYEQRVAGRVA